MGLQPWSDLSPSTWLVDSQEDSDRLISVGPDGFPAYARLRFLPDPTAPGQSEPVVRDPDRPTHVSRVQHALRVLVAFTTTPSEAYFCRWDGYEDLGLPPGWPLVDIPPQSPIRSFALYRGQVADIDHWGEPWGQPGDAPPAFAWPADHAWCFTHDVDPHWAVIAASQPAVDALLATPDLDVVQVLPTDEMPTYY